MNSTPLDTATDPKEAAACAGLAYVSDEEPGIRRRRAGKGFSYKWPDGTTVTEEETLARIRGLAIPPAYKDVWICPDPDGHLQATGRDAKGRKQYRYHPRWTELREGTKYGRMLEFCRALPRVRARVDEDLSRRGLPREKVLATVVRLLETTLIRVGNETYARENKSYGLTTLRDKHADIDGSRIRFSFKGKSGKEWKVTLKDRRLARVVRACRDVPGTELFQYVDEEGQRRAITSGDVNDYLRAITGEDFTAKDFRTWNGTVLAAMALKEFETFDSKAKAKRNVTRAIEQVASRLGNTTSVCRKSYVHPEILGAYMEGSLLDALKAEVEQDLREDLHGLDPEEVAVLAFLRERLERESSARESERKAQRRAAPAVHAAKPSTSGRDAMSKTTTDHDEIRKWAESHGGKPAVVKSTHGDDGVGLVRLMFPKARQSEHDSLEEISWNEFFKQFDDSKLALIYDEKSNFNKLIGRDTARH